MSTSNHRSPEARVFLDPRWWSPLRWDLRRGVLASLVLHCVFLVGYSVLAQARFDPPDRSDKIPVTLVAAPAPSVPQVEPPPPRVQRPPGEAIPDPLQKKKPPEKEPPVKPPEPTPKPVVKKPVEPPPEPPKKKTGKIDPEPTPRMVKPPLVASDDPAAMEIELEGPEFEYAYYINIVRKKISSKWRPPEGSAPAGVETATIVRFRIDRDGRVTSLEVFDPSGASLFDQTAQRAVQLASPLPPLPPKYEHPWLGVKLRFVYREPER